MQSTRKVACVAAMCMTMSLVVQSEAFGQANVAPTFTNLTDAKVQLWNAGLTVVDTNASVADSDSANVGGGFLSVRVVSGQATDRLSIRSLTTVGNINVLANDVRVVTSTGFQSVGTIIGSIPVTGATLLRVNLKSTATPAIVTKLLRSVTYRNQSTTAVSALKTLQFRASDGDGGISSPVNKTIRVGSLNGNYSGTFVGRVSAGGFPDTIPGLLISAGQNTVQTTVNGNAMSVTLPGLNATGTGTISATGTVSALSNGSIASFGVQVQFTGSLTLNPNGTASGSGTWSIVNNPGVTGSGTWTTSRPAQ